MTDTQDKSIRAECTSAGWFPEPKVEWLDLRGQPVPAETHFSPSASTGLLTVVSIVTVQERTVESLTCSISNPLFPEKKVAETYLPGEYLFSSAIKGNSRRWVPGMYGESCRAEPEKPLPAAWPRGHGDVGFQNEAVMGFQRAPAGRQERCILMLVVAVVGLRLFFFKRSFSSWQI